MSMNDVCVGHDVRAPQDVRERPSSVLAGRGHRISQKIAELTEMLVSTAEPVMHPVEAVPTGSETQADPSFPPAVHELYNLQEEALKRLEALRQVILAINI